jgi:hypothetical protein
MRRICHYCGGHGNTRDHIVAQRWYRSHRKRVPQLVAALNKVWACDTCNGNKDSMRTDCECEICTRAWEVMAPYIRPRVKSDIPVITVDELVALRGKKPYVVPDAEPELPNWMR